MKRWMAIVMMVAALLSGCGVMRGGGSVAPPPESPLPERVAPPPQEVPEAAAAQTLALTIPPGATLLCVGRALEEMGVCTAAELIEAAQSSDFSEFSLVAAQAPNPNRFFALEGYLFPGVFEIYPDESPDSIIRRILSNTERVMDADLRQAIADSGYTVDEIITIASIIQKESLGIDAVKPLVSSVIHNRLHAGMMLQMCYTAFYVRDVIDPFFDGEANPFGPYYNTYICPALPAGAICNPGLEAIRAALLPADTAYFFYIWDDDDGFHFAVTWEEHVANVQRYLR